MRRHLLCLLALVCVSSLAAQQPYKTPPQVIVDILDAPPLPAAQLSPDRQWMLLMEQRSMPTIAEFSEPMLRLAGFRINPRTNGPARITGLSGLLLKRVADGSERRITTPPNARLAGVSWSPDGKRLAFSNIREDGIELWIADAATGAARAATPATLNGVGTSPCEWLADGARLVCRFIPEGRGAPPVASAVPVGPNVQETSGRAAPAPTFQDLLQTPHDEDLFDYYFTSQLALVDATTGAVTKLGSPAAFDTPSPSPDGRYLLVERVVRPYSYLVTVNGFPSITEVWTVAGERVAEIARLPVAEGTPLGGVRAGRRTIYWRPNAPASLVLVEALDGGDTRRPAEVRDQVALLPAPFTGQPAELARTKDRWAGLRFGDNGLVLLSEFNRMRRWTKTTILNADRPAEAARVLWDRSAEDRYGDPGAPLMKSTPGGAILLQVGDNLFLSGDGATPEGDRPFLDRLNLRTLRTERVWRGDAGRYEAPVALVDDQARQIVTRAESATEPPNYFVRDLRTRRLRALTRFPDPAPQLTGVQKQLVTYAREDGIPLSGTLYLPPGYRPGTRVPLIMWAYPTEFASAQAAGQVRTTANRFTFYRGISHLLLLTQGYAIFDDPKMPIVGGDTANNTYVQQLVASARAAVNKVVEMGVADPERIGVGGHSYGAFMTANLLAHSDLFRAGIARSGAYNRTLTPFGFQNEQRSFWQARDIYMGMSPFTHADSINEPILLIHGEEDNNTGTFPIQSERLYHALKGHGATTRLVMLPFEAHGYAARESVMHVQAEMVEWFDKYVKNAGGRRTAGSQ